MIHPKHIAAVMYEAIEKGEDASVVVSRTKSFLDKKRMTALLPRVSTILTSLFESKSKGNAHLFVAKMKDAPTALKALRDKSIDTDAFTIDVRENIIGGYIATIGSRQIDASYKSSLLRFYKNITN
jgi:F0F1-type ATP synthase delta subunit